MTIQGIDPGALTTASMNATKCTSMFESIDRYKALVGREEPADFVKTKSWMGRGYIKLC